MEDMACSMGVFKVQNNDRRAPIPPSSNTSFTTAMVLPEPTCTPPDPKKKSHARKQPEGHIPRPRNAFILFRCDYVRQKKIPAEVEKDHRNISRIVGQIWRKMDDKQKEPWVLMAEREKMAHSNLYASYRSSTGVLNKKSKRGDDITQKPEDRHLDDSDLLDLYRSSSCPPGTLHVSQANFESCNSYGAPLKTRDDLARRPSRVAFYQSASHRPISPPNKEDGFTDINDQHYFAEFIQGDHFKAVADPECYTEADERKAHDMPEGGLEAKFCGPRINIHPYHTPGLNDPPEWDFAPIQPHTWTDWSTFQLYQASSASTGIFGTDANKPFFIDPFLSTLPPLPHICDSHDTFPPVDGSVQQQPSFTTLEMEASSTYPPLERCQLPDAPPEYVHNIAKYHYHTTNDPPRPSFRNQ